MPKLPTDTRILQFADYVHDTYLWMIAYFLRQCRVPTTLTASELRTHAKLSIASWTGSFTTLIRIYYLDRRPASSTAPHPSENIEPPESARSSKGSNYRRTYEEF